MQVHDDFLEEGARLLLGFLFLIEFLNVLHVLRAQFIDDASCCLGITLSVVVRDFYKRVCCTRHGREDHNLLLSVVDEADHFFHALGRTYGGAAKF